MFDKKSEKRPKLPPVVDQSSEARKKRQKEAAKKAPAGAHYAQSPEARRERQEKRA